MIGIAVRDEAAPADGPDLVSLSDPDRDYFDGPVRIEIPTTDARRLWVGLGVCTDAKLCVPTQSVLEVPEITHPGPAETACTP